MAKRPERLKKSTRPAYDVGGFAPAVTPDPRFTARRKKAEPLEAQTEAQGHYISAFITSKLIFGIGPAGTGKTYCAATYAADQLLGKHVEKIIITRPNIEVGAGMGFLPGELEDKFLPYLAPFREIMIDRMGLSQYECAVKLEKISPQPLGFMRGKTFSDAIVILDEAQNVTPTEMKMFLTRIGENCTVIVDGDADQCDLSGPSGLMDAVDRLHNVRGVSVVEFTEDDIVRSGLVRDILRAYRP